MSYFLNLLKLKCRRTSTYLQKTIGKQSGSSKYKIRSPQEWYGVINVKEIVSDIPLLGNLNLCLKMPDSMLQESTQSSHPFQKKTSKTYKIICNNDKNKTIFPINYKILQTQK